MSDIQHALIIGNSDGIGLGLTQRLLDLGWTVRGISRSSSSITHDRYTHVVADVASDDYLQALAEACTSAPDLCVYCVGIGDLLDITAMAQETLTFEVNLMGAMRTYEIVVPPMVERKHGHIIMLTSIADEHISPEAPSYSASKAGLTTYTEGLALALRAHGVAVTNVRFGFVDTKMAKGDHKPMMISVERAVDSLMHCVEKRPIRFTRPRIMSWLVRLHAFFTRLRLRFLRG